MSLYQKSDLPIAGMLPADKEYFLHVIIRIMNRNLTISVMIKPSSALCNLRCRYCFYMDESKNRDVPSHGLMKKETMVRLVDRIAEYLDGRGVANVSFQGGEPMMSGIDYYRDFIFEMKKHPGIKVHYSIQTNGTLIDEEFAQFFRENNFLLGVSVDGYEENMNYYRVGPHIGNTHRKVLEGIEILKKHKVEFNILTVITRKLAEHPGELFDFYLAQKYEFVQLIPCLPAFGVEDDGMSLTPELYASFYRTFFRAWQRAFLKGRYINVNLFENLMAMLQGYYPYQCGMLGKCASQQVVESNGDVFPCDFYCLDEYKMGNVHDLSFSEMRISDGVRELMKGSDCEKEICRACKFRSICHGGCQRQNVCYLKDDHCAYQKVLNEVVPKLQELMKRNQ